MTGVESRELVVRPIGIVRNGYHEKPATPWEETISEIVVDEALTEALFRIEEYSHIHIIFWLDQAESQRGRYLRLHPERREELPEAGIFALRAMFRPNPIGLTSVKLLGRQANILQVQGLDALDGTPVLDLKPYLTRGDCWPEATVPWWILQLWAMHDARHPESP